jgi:TRAP-type C4-dicarboxylate transport system permease small subunit
LIQGVENPVVLWNRFINGVNWLTRAALILGFALMAIFVMMQIIWRYILLIPLPWSEEAARYLLVWISLLAAALAFRDDSHIRLDVFVSRLPAGAQRWVHALLQIATLGFVAMVLCYGIPQAKLGKFTNSPGLNISMFAAYASIPVSALIMILNIIDHMLRSMVAGERPHGQEQDPS